MSPCHRAHEPEVTHLTPEEMEEDHLVQSASPVLGFGDFLEMTISTHSVGGGQLLRKQNHQPLQTCKHETSWRRYRFCPFEHREACSQDVATKVTVPRVRG